MSEGIGIKYYLAGALLANSITMLLISFSYSYLLSISELYVDLGIWVIAIFSDTVAGFLLTRTLKEKQLIFGAVVGMFSYILYVLLSLFGFISQADDLWIFFGYLLGGLLGGRLGEKGEIKLDLSFLGI